jgi:hypothetical protein
MGSSFNRLPAIPNPPPEIAADDPNPGVEFVVFTRRSRLWEVAAIIGEVGGHATVSPRALPEGEEWYLTVIVPYGRTKSFKERLWEEGLCFVGMDRTSRLPRRI